MKYLLMTFTFALFSSVAYGQEYSLYYDWELAGDPPDSVSNPMDDWQLVVDDMGGYVSIEKYTSGTTSYDIEIGVEDDSSTREVQGFDSVDIDSVAYMSSWLTIDDFYVDMYATVNTSFGYVSIDVELLFELDGVSFSASWGIEYEDFTYTGPSSVPTTINPYIGVTPPQGHDPDDPEFREWLSDDFWSVE
ncbi:hypothetical protein OAU50_00575 [Planctomycetota bacterium]|nr:hypothetical protein [Planctomycetota bacterium]